MGVLDDKVAIVTGSARGIGRATAELLSAQGAKVLINDLDADAAAEAASEPREVRLWVTRPQLRVLARHGAEVVGRGRPPCPLCGNPLDATGHVCPAMNGHRPAQA